jgi:hypothetical protein
MMLPGCTALKLAMTPGIKTSSKRYKKTPLLIRTPWLPRELKDSKD